MTTHYEKIQALGNRMASNLETMGVSASFSDGGLTLADKILQIQHFTDGLLLYADKSIIQIDDTANFYALLLKDGYPQSNEEIKFFVESNSPTLRTLTADTDNIVSPRYSFASMPTFSDSSETVYLDADHSISLRKFGSNQVQLCGAVGTTCHVNVTSISLNNNVLTYTSKGGTTTVDVSDKDMSVIYSDVEGVTINDYYSVYTANTGSNGVATVTYTGVGAGNLNVQAKTIDGRLQSETFSLLDCIAIDKGTQAEHNDSIWNAVNRFSREEEYTIFTHTLLANVYNSISGDVCIEFDASASTINTNPLFSIRTDNRNLLQATRSQLQMQENTFYHIKVEIKDNTGTITNIDTDKRVTGSVTGFNRFYLRVDNETIQFKNLKVYSI